MLLWLYMIGISSNKVLGDFAQPAILAAAVNYIKI